GGWEWVGWGEAGGAVGERTAGRDPGSGGCSFVARIDEPAHQRVERVRLTTQAEAQGRNRLSPLPPSLPAIRITGRSGFACWRPRAGGVFPRPPGANRRSLPSAPGNSPAVHGGVSNSSFAGKLSARARGACGTVARAATLLTCCTPCAMFAWRANTVVGFFRTASVSSVARH